MADDELSLRRSADRAAKAQALIDSDLFKEAFGTLREGYVNAWIVTDARDDDGRQRCWLAVKNLDRVKEHLERVIGDGKIATAMLDLNEAKAKREKRA